jgi:hypothetical protein
VRSHIIDDLRPELVDVDPEWDDRTLRAIMGEPDDRVVSSPRRWGWPARLVLVAAAVVLIAGAAYVAGTRLPQDDVRPAGPVQTPAPGSDEAIFAETTEAMKSMDGTGATTPEDHTSKAIGTDDFPLGTAPADAYIFFKLGVECVGNAKYQLGLNGDFQGAGVHCDGDDSISGLSYEFPQRVAAGSENTLSIAVDQPLHYTVTVGYRTKSIHDVGPRGTLPDGRTYGYQEGGVADMMLVTGASGRQGYVDHDEISGLPASPAEAIRQQKEREQRYRNGERIDRTIPVYDTNGKQVDVFNIMLPKPR